MYFRVYQALYVRPFTSYEEVPRTTHSTAVWSAVVHGIITFRDSSDKFGLLFIIDEEAYAPG